MRNCWKKILACSLCAMLVGTTFNAFGCGIKPEISGEFYEEIDQTRTQLYIGNFNGGLGWQWLNEAKELYEKDHPNVQIMINNDKDRFLPNILINNFKTNQEDMYVLDECLYYDYLNSGHLLEITDVVTKGGENSIEARMNSSLRDYFKTNDNKYYGVPFYQSFIHFIYDVDLFDSYKLWLNVDGTGFVKSLDEPRYPGISGEDDAWDKGLPRTYSQFFMLLDRMVSLSITPVTWAGNSRDQYLGRLINNLVADYSGAEFAANYSFNGQVKYINNYDFTEPAVGTFSLPSSAYSTQTVTFDNAVDYLVKDAGKYFALKFAKDLVSGGMKYLRTDKVNSTAETNVLAHDTFLRSRYLNEKNGNSKPIGMLAEGVWWVNEARPVFTAMEEYGPEWSLAERRFGIMPFPKADDGSSADGRTVSVLGGSAIVISNYTEKAEIAKDFFEFIHTDESLQRFTAETFVMRPFNYTLSDERLATLPYYIQNVVKFTREADFEFTVPRTRELKPYYNNLQRLFVTFTNNYSYNNPLVAFIENTNVTAKDYFKGLRPKELY